MFKSYWIIGTYPLNKYTVETSLMTVATLDDEPKSWKLFLVLFKTAFYVRISNSRFYDK
jgi:hypothetical protein